MQAQKMKNWNIRFAGAGDAADIISIYRPIVTDTAITFELSCPSEVDMVARIIKSQLAHAWLVCYSGEQIAGYAYASTFRERAAYRWITEVSVYVHPEYHKRGVAHALYDALHDILKSQGYLTSMAVMTYPNPASEGFHARYGYAPQVELPHMGYKFDSWHGIKIMSKSIGEPHSPMNEIISSSQLAASKLNEIFSKAQKQLE